MANINNKLGTNGAYGGRTSVEAFNDVLGAFNGAGVLSGWKAEPSGGLSVILGGDGENRDVAIALDNQGDKTTVNNISKQPITITLPSAPASGTRKDNIVAYIDKPVQADDTALDNPSAVNIFITSADTDNAIRSAITQDGGAGTNAFYVVLASVNLNAGTTDITADMIKQGTKAKIGSQNIDYAYIVYRNNTAVSVPGTNTNTRIPAVNIDASGGSWKEYFQAQSDGTIKILKDCTVRTNFRVYATSQSGTAGRISISLNNNTKNLYLNSRNYAGVAMNYIMYETGVGIADVSAGDILQAQMSSTSQTLGIAPNPGQTFIMIELVE